jgi:hypothetical protein
MSSITYYLLDDQRVWNGATSVRSVFEPQPFSATSVPPPENPDNKILRFIGNWEFVEPEDIPPPAPAPFIPLIVITEIKEDGVVLNQTDFSVVNTMVGKRLDFKAELRHPDLGFVLPVDDQFRMPIRSRDGREEVILAHSTQGIITFGIDFTESRIWTVTEEVINRDLPVEKRMGFAGVTVFVLKL